MAPKTLREAPTRFELVMADLQHANDFAGRGRCADSGHGERRPDPCGRGARGLTRRGRRARMGRFAAPGSNPLEDVAMGNEDFVMGSFCFYTVIALICGGLAAGVALPRKAAIYGLILGLLFGPLGLIAAFRLDERPQCPYCLSRINGRIKGATVCPYCRNDLFWRRGEVLLRQEYEQIRAKEAKSRR